MPRLISPKLISRAGIHGQDGAAWNRSKKVAKTLKDHWDGILAYYDNWTTSAAIEAINGKLQLARKRARGYRNFESFQAIAYWIAGEIKVATDLPNPLPETF